MTVNESYREALTEKHMTDPGCIADVMAGNNEAAKNILRCAGVVEYGEVCEHDWHYYGNLNGRPEYACQLCGKIYGEVKPGGD
jgi:hypothetical protein